jgi:transcriptional regulator with XRE-family HTH domain
MEPGEKTRQSFGMRLRAFREDAGLAADDLAKRIQIHLNSLYRLERGDQWVGADVLERISEALGVPASALLEDPEAKPTRPAKLRLLEIVAAFDEHQAQALLPEAEALKAGPRKPALLEAEKLELDEGEGSSG